MSSNNVIKSSGVVVFLDLLGVKGGWRNAESMITQWDALIDLSNSLSKKMKRDLGSDVTTYSFSDTLIMTAPAEPDTLTRVLCNLVYFWCALLPSAFSNRLFFRGCLSIGDFYTSNSKRMLVGPAIDEAVQYHALAEWVGISLAPSANILINEQFQYKDLVGLIKYPNTA